MKEHNATYGLVKRIKSLDPAANLQKIKRTEEYAKLNHEYVIRKTQDSWEILQVKKSSFLRDQFKEKERRTSLVVQWLRLRAPNAGGPVSIPGLGTRPQMLQLRFCMPQLTILHATRKIPNAETKILRAAIKTWRSQINKY